MVSELILNAANNKSAKSKLRIALADRQPNALHLDEHSKIIDSRGLKMARDYIETVLKEVSRKSGFEQDADLLNLIKSMENLGHIDVDLGNKLHDIRKAGNWAAHGEEISPAKRAKAWESLISLNWDSALAEPTSPAKSIERAPSTKSHIAAAQPLAVKAKGTQGANATEQPQDAARTSSKGSKLYEAGRQSVDKDARETPNFIIGRKIARHSLGFLVGLLIAIGAIFILGRWAFSAISSIVSERIAFTIILGWIAGCSIYGALRPWSWVDPMRLLQGQDPHRGAFRLKFFSFLALTLSINTLILWFIFDSSVDGFRQISYRERSLQASELAKDSPIELVGRFRASQTRSEDISEREFFAPFHSDYGAISTNCPSFTPNAEGTRQRYELGIVYEHRCKVISPNGNRYFHRGLLPYEIPRSDGRYTVGNWTLELQLRPISEKGKTPTEWKTVSSAEFEVLP